MFLNIYIYISFNVVDLGDGSYIAEIGEEFKFMWDMLEIVDAMSCNVIVAYVL